MGRITENQYELKLTKEQMKKRGFKYDPKLDAYIYRFPVYKNNDMPLVFCKLGIDEDTHRVWFNVYDANDALYPSYYNSEYGNNQMVFDIDKVISGELVKLGVKKVD